MSLLRTSCGDVCEVRLDFNHSTVQIGRGNVTPIFFQNHSDLFLTAAYLPLRRSAFRLPMSTLSASSHFEESAL